MKTLLTILPSFFVLCCADTGTDILSLIADRLHFVYFFICAVLLCSIGVCCYVYRKNAADNDDEESLYDSEYLREIVVAALKKPNVSAEVLRYLNTVEHDSNASRRLNINGRDCKGRTPLIEICDIALSDLNCSERFLFELVVDLVHAGANIFAVDVEGRTAFVAATFSGHLKIAGFLEGLMSNE
uniref:ANK_REP_REGION domain-containing protein n=1 Tax=Steinernema glaseri TaxID=37863 RepID=A0A1I7Z7W9_9BILA